MTPASGFTATIGLASSPAYQSAHRQLDKAFAPLTKITIDIERADGESALLPLFCLGSALSYRNPQSGGVVSQGAWRHGPYPDGLLQPQISAEYLTLRSSRVTPPRQSELFVQSRFPDVACKKVDQSPDNRLDSLIESHAYHALKLYTRGKSVDGLYK